VYQQTKIDNMVNQTTDNAQLASSRFSAVNISILGFMETENQWVAIALEMDLRGYGTTFETALNELEELIEMQFSFAHFKNDPDLIFHPSEPVYWRLYAQANLERLRTLSNGTDTTEPEYQTGILSLPPAHVISSPGRDFYPATA